MQRDRDSRLPMHAGFLILFLTNDPKQTFVHDNNLSNNQPIQIFIGA